MKHTEDSSALSACESLKRDGGYRGKGGGGLVKLIVIE